jgi:hypothetical protein
MYSPILKNQLGLNAWFQEQESRDAWRQIPKTETLILFSRRYLSLRYITTYQNVCLVLSLLRQRIFSTGD